MLTQSVLIERPWKLTKSRKAKKKKKNRTKVCNLAKQVEDKFAAENTDI